MMLFQRSHKDSTSPLFNLTNFTSLLLLHLTFALHQVIHHRGYHLTQKLLTLLALIGVQFQPDNPSVPSYEPEPFRISPPNTESYDPSSHKLPTSAPSSTPSYEPKPFHISPPDTEPLRALSTIVPPYNPILPPPYDPSSHKLPTFMPPAPSGLVPQNFHGHGMLFGQVGLHCYNLLNETNLEFLDLDEFYLTGLVYRKIKVNAYDAIGNAYREFITRVVPSKSKTEKVCMRFNTTECRLLPAKVNHPCDFDELAVDDFFKGDMPNSMPAEDTSVHNPQYYTLKESEVEENMCWLRVYARLAIYTKNSPGSGWTGPTNLTKVIVQTKENVDSEKKIKALNAIFYIRLKTFRNIDCYFTIRRTTDGIPGHMSLEVKCLN